MGGSRSGMIPAVRFHGRVNWLERLVWAMRSRVAMGAVEWSLASRASGLWSSWWTKVVERASKAMVGSPRLRGRWTRTQADAEVHKAGGSGERSIVVRESTGLSAPSRFRLMTAAAVLYVYRVSIFRRTHQSTGKHISVSWGCVLKWIPPCLGVSCLRCSLWDGSGRAGFVCIRGETGAVEGVPAWIGGALWAAGAGRRLRRGRGVSG